MNTPDFLLYLIYLATKQKTKFKLVIVPLKVQYQSIYLYYIQKKKE